MFGHVWEVMLSHPNIRTGRMPLHVLVTSNAVTPKHSHLANWLIEQMTAVLQFKPVGANAPLDMVRADARMLLHLGRAKRLVAFSLFHRHVIRVYCRV